MPQKFSMPSDSQLSATLVQGHETCSGLDKFAELEIADRKTDEETLGCIEDVADEVLKKSEEFNAKHQTEFSSWIQNQQHSQALSEERKEAISGTLETLKAVESYMRSCVTIAESTNRVLELGERDLKQFNTSSHDVMLGMDYTFTDHNVSRAPAAS